MEHSFAVTNGCPKCFLEHTLESFESPRVISQVTDNSRQNRVYILKLPFKREQGNKIKSISNTANRMLSSNHEPRFILTATRLGFKFNINGKTEHNHDFFYSAKCPHSNCTDKYIEETTRRLNERTTDRADRDTKSILVKYVNRINHLQVEIDNDVVLNKGSHINTYERRISSALFIKNTFLT